MIPKTVCPFCSVDRQKFAIEGKTVFVIEDGFPVSPGHCLVIPKRHVESFFETSAEEQTDILTTLKVLKSRIDDQFHPDGYNIGVNDGRVAGQTVMHLHIHLIPRYSGDTVEPRGGIRWIFPNKAKYWND